MRFLHCHVRSRTGRVLMRLFNFGVRAGCTSKSLILILLSKRVAAAYEISWAVAERIASCNAISRRSGSNVSTVIPTLSGESAGKNAGDFSGGENVLTIGDLT